MAIKAIEERRAEREHLISLAREYAGLLAERVELKAAVLAGSVARGDFNVWSDIDVVVVAAELPRRAPDRAGLLLEGAPPRVQPVGYTPAELRQAIARGNRLVREAIACGIVLHGEPLDRVG